MQRRRGSEEPPSCLQITAGLAAEKGPAGREDRRTAGRWKTTGLPIEGLGGAGRHARRWPSGCPVWCFSKHIRPLDCHRRHFLGAGPGCARKREGRGVDWKLKRVGVTAREGMSALWTRDSGQGTLCFWVLGTVKRGWVTVICVRVQEQVNWKRRRQG